MPNSYGSFTPAPSAQESENGIVVDGVSDTEHDFPSQVRLYGFRLGFAVTNAVGHHTLPLKNFGGKASKFIDQVFGDETRAHDRAFHFRVPAPLIVVNLARANSFRQTEKVIEHMPIVRTERRRGLSCGWILEWASCTFHHRRDPERCSPAPDTSVTAMFNDRVIMSEPFPEYRNLHAVQEQSDGARHETQRWPGRTEVPCLPAPRYPGRSGG